MAILIQKYPKNYFGINETTNIFTGDTAPINVVDEYFRIPSVVNIDGEEWVAVNTGYVPLETQPLEDFEFEITDDNGSSLQALQLVIGTPKDPSSKPASNVVVWFNQPYIKGCYYVNSQWLGKVFHIKKGKYVSTTANAGRLNEISSNYEFVNRERLLTNDTLDNQNIGFLYNTYKQNVVTEIKTIGVAGTTTIIPNDARHSEIADRATNATNADIATRLKDVGFRVFNITALTTINPGFVLCTLDSGNIKGCCFSIANSSGEYIGSVDYKIKGRQIIYNGVQLSSLRALLVVIYTY